MRLDTECLSGTVALHGDLMKRGFFTSKIFQLASEHHSRILQSMQTTYGDETPERQSLFPCPSMVSSPPSSSSLALRDLCSLLLINELFDDAVKILIPAS